MWELQLFSGTDFRQFSIKTYVVSTNEYPQHMVLWRNKQNYPLIITKYPPYLFHCIQTSRSGSEPVRCGIECFQFFRHRLILFRLFFIQVSQFPPFRVGKVERLWFG